jgi:hypothetical protein
MEPLPAEPGNELLVEVSQRLSFDLPENTLQQMVRLSQSSPTLAEIPQLVYDLMVFAADLVELTDPQKHQLVVAVTTTVLLNQVQDEDVRKKLILSLDRTITVYYKLAKGTQVFKSSCSWCCL